MRDFQDVLKVFLEADTFKPEVAGDVPTFEKGMSDAKNPTHVMEVFNKEHAVLMSQLEKEVNEAVTMLTAIVTKTQRFTMSAGNAPKASTFAPAPELPHDPTGGSTARDFWAARKKKLAGGAPPTGTPPVGEATETPATGAAAAPTEMATFSYIKQAKDKVAMAFETYNKSLKTLLTNLNTAMNTMTTTQSGLQTQLDDVKEKLKTVSQEVGDNHVKVLGIKKQLEELQQHGRDEDMKKIIHLTGLADDLSAQLLSAKKNVANLQKQLDAVDDDTDAQGFFDAYDKIKNYAVELKKKYEVLRQEYEKLETRTSGFLKTNLADPKSSNMPKEESYGHFDLKHHLEKALKKQPKHWF